MTTVPPATSPQQLSDAVPGERVTSFISQDIALPGGKTLALVTLDNGHDHTKPNTLGPSGLMAAHTTFTECRRRAAAGDIHGVAVTGKPFIFAAGADLKDVSVLTSPADARGMANLGHSTLRLLGDMGVPTFAFINGAIIGGGVEIALHCDYRTSSPTVPMAALPECFLGLVPGWGGTYLLPRIIGPGPALSVMIENALRNNKMLKGPQLAQLGISDVEFASVNFLEDSIAWAATIIAGETTIDRPDHTADADAWDDACDTALAAVNAVAGNPDVAPAPYRAIELVRTGRTKNRDAGFAAEADALTELILSDQFRAGVYSFNLTQFRARKPTGAPDKKLARDISKVGIVGAGLMASQLAVLFIRRLEVPVIMTDLDADRIHQGIDYVHGEFTKMEQAGRITADAANRYRALIHGDTSKDRFADADFVIEAVFEDLSLKQRVFAEVEAVVSPECVLATNTSSLSVTDMAAGLNHPQRVVGFHFFNPVSVMPLLEVVRAQHTDDSTLATAFAVAKKLKKTAVAVTDSTSFVVNRLLGRFMGEVGRLVDDGTPLEVADSAFAGIAPMPPFHLLGLVGPAIALHNSESLQAAFGDRFYVSPTLKELVAHGKRAVYVDGHVDPNVAQLFTNTGGDARTADQVRHTVLAALADEVRRMLDEQVVAEPEDIDLAMITGAGFPFWCGGLCPLLDRTGIAEEATGARFLAPGVASVATGT